MITVDGAQKVTCHVFSVIDERNNCDLREMESVAVATIWRWRVVTGMGRKQGTVIQRGWKIGLTFMAQQCNNSLKQLIIHL